MCIVDDCWSIKGDRDENGHIRVDENKFPDGISGLADKVHDMGLKIGIYSCELERVLFRKSILSAANRENDSCWDYNVRGLSG